MAGQLCLLRKARKLAETVQPKGSPINWSCRACWLRDRETNWLRHRWQWLGALWLCSRSLGCSPWLSGLQITQDNDDFRRGLDYISVLTRRRGSYNWPVRCVQVASFCTWAYWKLHNIWRCNRYTCTNRNSALHVGYTNNNDVGEGNASERVLASKHLD